MTSFQSKLLEWSESRLDALLRAPRMWGSNEAVEMQSILLMELRALALRPYASHGDINYVFESYVTFLRDKYPEHPPAPLSKLSISEREFVDTLTTFRQEFASRFIQEDLFQHAELVMRLEFRPNCAPSAMSVTNYSDELRRATRAFARGSDQQVGRARKEIESITDFALSDIRVSSPNGKPGEAWIIYKCGHLPQQDHDAEGQVKGALSTISRLAQWLDSEAPVSEVPIDDPELELRAAVQTMRLLPKRDVTEVQLGGQLLGASRPATLRSIHADRCIAILAAKSECEQFDVTDEIRGIDLDRGTIILGKKRIACYGECLRLGTEIREVGVHARICGMLYKPPLSKPFVIANHIEVEADTAQDLP